MISWHESKDARSVHQSWKTLATPDFDGQWHSEYIEHVICKKVWSPIKWRDGVRKESHFLGAFMCALDFDSPQTNLEWARKTFADYNCTIGTTKSHQKEKNGVVCDRFRVCLWFDEPITELEKYKHNMALLIAKYGADRACKDGARFFFPCVEIVESHDGDSIPASALPVAVLEKTTLYSAHKRRGMNYVVNAQPAVSERNSTMFKEGCRLFRTKLDYNLIVDKLRIISNGLPEEEFLRTLERCQEYAKK